LFLVLFFYLIFDITKIFLLLSIKVVLYLQRAILGGPKGIAKFNLSALNAMANF